jgi:hypothetical protein
MLLRDCGLGLANCSFLDVTRFITYPYAKCLSWHEEKSSTWSKQKKQLC